MKELRFFLGCVYGISEAYNFVKKSISSTTSTSTSVFLFFPNTSSEAASEFPGFEVKTFDTAASTYEQDVKNYKAALTQWYKNYESSLQAFPGLTLLPTFSEAYSAFKTNYVVDAKLESYITSIVINNYLSRVYDPHTYITPTKYTEQMYTGVVSNSGGGKGIFGILFLKVKYKEDAYYAVRGIEHNSPALAAGLNVGDVVLSANGKVGADNILKEVSNKEVETIDFEVERLSGVKKIKISRAIFSSDAVEGKLVETQKKVKVAYIRLRNFMDKEACSKIESLGTKLIQEGATGIVLDLRDNGGGLVQMAMCINELYLEQGSKIGAIKQTGKTQIKYTYSTKVKNRIFKDLNNVTLINGYSASASEWLSIFLQAYRKSLIVGEKSYGKGTMQSVVADRGNSLVTHAATVAKFYGPQGISPQLQTVVPDIEAYPFYTQTEATPYEREADSYENALLGDELRPIVMSDRQLELDKIKSCLSSNRYADLAYESKNDFLKRVHDHQVAVALSSVDCMIEEEIKPYRGIDIPVVDQN